MHIEKIRHATEAVNAINQIFERLSRIERQSVGPGTQRVIAGGGSAIFQPKRQAESRKSAGGQAGPVSIRLAPEYAGAVLWDDPESAYGDLGTMNGHYDASTPHSAYKWTTDHASLQEYCVAVRVPVPVGFNSWGDCSFYAHISAAAGAGTAVVLTDIYDTGNTRVGPATPVSVTATAWTDQAFTMPASTYTAEAWITLIFRLRAISNSFAYLGELSMDVS